MGCQAWRAPPRKGWWFSAFLLPIFRISFAQENASLEEREKKIRPFIRPELSPF